MSEQNSIIQKIKSNIYENISYTSQDYETIIGELIELLPILSPDWNNVSETDIIFIMLSLMAAHKDILNYMIDYRILETYMSTAKERASLVRIANSFGYKIPSYKASKAGLTYTSAASTDGSIVPAVVKLMSFTQFVDPNGIPWAYIDEDRDLALGNSIEVYQGVIKTVTKNMSDIDTESMTYVLSNQNVAIGNNANSKSCSKLVIYKDESNPIIFTEVDNLYTYNGDSTLIYELNVDPQGLTYVRFLKNLNISAFNEYNITFYYLNTQSDTVSSIGNQTKALVYNTSNSNISYEASFNYSTNSFVLGSSPIQTSEIREGFKHYYAGMNSLVSLDDYKNFILYRQKVVPNIQKYLIIDGQTSTLSTGLGSSDFTDSNFGIYLVKNGNIELTNDEVDLISAEINKYKVAGSIPNYNGVSTGAPIAKVDIELRLNKLPANSTVLSEFKALLANYINSKNIGESLTTSELYSLILNSKFAAEYIGGLTIILKNLENNDTNTIKLDFEYNEYLNCQAANIVLIP